VSEAVIQRLKISREGVILIKSFEGFRPRAIRRDDGGWVIGYGHTLSAREGATVGEADAELLLQYDLIPVARAVNEGVVAPLNQHQFDALASFAFSVGVDRFQTSDVLSRLNAGFAGEAADALIGWPEPVVAETALRRRAAERALFVANPGLPVALADLLAAPLPPPYRGPVEPPVPTPAASVEPEVPAEYLAPDLAQDAAPESEHEPEQNSGPSARQAAVAALLAEPAPVLHAPDSEAPEPETAEPEAAAEAPEPVAEAAPEAASVEPAPSEAAEPELVEPELVEPEPVEPESAAAETAPADAKLADTDPAEAPSDPAATPSDASVTPVPAPAPASFSSVLPMQRYAAYSGVIVGPLPGPAPSLRITPPAGASAVPAPVVDIPAAEAEAPASVEPEAVNPFAPPAVAEEPVAEEPVAEEPVTEEPAVEEAAVEATPVPDAESEAAVETPAAPQPVQTGPAAWFVDPASAIAAAPTETRNGTRADPFAHLPAPEPAPEAIAEAAQPEAPAVATPEPEAAPVPEVVPVFDAPAFDAPAEPNPFALPPAPSPFPAAAPASGEHRLELPVFGAPTSSPASIPEPSPFPAITATSEPRTDGELVLTPSPDTEVFASPRLVWPHGEQAGDDTTPLFEDDGSLRLAPGNILRHEIVEDAAEPARIPWGELAAYGVMGGFGLVSFGMSMAAFRRAAGEDAGGDGTVLIAVVLAVVGAACVGVSAYNLYRRWGRTDEE